MKHVQDLVMFKTKDNSLQGCLKKGTGHYWQLLSKHILSRCMGQQPREKRTYFTATDLKKCKTEKHIQ